MDIYGAKLTNKLLSISFTSCMSMFLVLSISLCKRSTQCFVLMALCLVSSARLTAGGAVFDPEPFVIPENVYQANYIREINGVSVMEFSGNYDRSLSDGQLNAAARAVVAQEFYANNPDNYDFLVVYTDFEFDTGDAQAFHIGVANDTSGIGLPIFSNRELFGSVSELDGYIDMASIDRYQTNPLASVQNNQQVDFTQGLRVLAHETLHQWGIRTEIEDFQGRDDAHWNFFMDTDASVEYGHDWIDNNDGTFTAEAARIGFSKLDLYLMGLASADEVPDTFVITPSNDDYDREDLPRAGITVSGTRTDYSVQDFIDVHGERTPSSEDAPKVFRYAFVYLTPTGNGSRVVQADVERINTIRRAYEDRFAILTGGRAIAQVNHSARIETSPGQFDTVGDDSTELSQRLDINLALSWLASQQSAQGFWSDMPATSIRDTVTALSVIENYANQPEVAQRSRLWLSEQEVDNTDSLARLVQVGGLANNLAVRLTDLQGADGGWSLSERYQSSVMDTALAICAHTTNGTAVDSGLLGRAASFLEQRQNADNGWSAVQGATSSINVTSEVLRAFSCLQKDDSVTTSGLEWLISQVRSDSGFGDDQSTVHETARALQTLLLFDSVESISSADSADYLIQRQSINGDWEGSVYTTSLVIDTLQSLNFPNLRLLSINHEPEVVRDGDFVTLTAVIENDSNSPIPTASVRFIRVDGSNAPTTVQQLNLPFLPPFSSVNVTTVLNTFGLSGSNTIRVIADPDSQIVERLESDNQLDLTLSVQSPVPGVELSVSDTEFDVTPDSINELPASLEFFATLRNIGDADADNVLIQLLSMSGNNEPVVLESSTIDMPARSSEGVSFAIQSSVAGDQTFLLRVDANASFDELNEDNNEARVLLTSVEGIDLEVTDADIGVTPESLWLNQNGQFSLVVRNNGASSVNNARLTVTVQNASGDTPILESDLIFEPGEQKTITANWLADFDGESTVLVELDSENLIAEIDETNNQATFTVTTRLAQGANLSVNPRDLRFNPSPAFEGMSAQLSVVVRNNGTQSVPNSVVRFFDGNPAAGGEFIAETNLVNIGAGESATADVVWPQVSQGSVHFIYAVVETTVNELNVEDNIAFERLDVLSLPDFAISPESIQSEPSFPRVNEETTFNVLITNRGRQAGENVRLSAHIGSASGPEIASTDVNIPASGDITWQFSTIFTSLGESSVFIQVDPDNSIIESDESNNSATRSVLIQDGAFFISNLYLSPNGDGVNDTVDYTFTLDAPSEVAVVVLDRFNQTIREFEFADQAVESQLITWDGLNSNGGRAADGLYRVAVQDVQGALLGERSVTIDTNRSPLSEALGTRFSFTRNLTCRIGDVSSGRRDFAGSLDTTFTEVVYGPSDEFIYFTTFFRPFFDNGNLVQTDDVTLFPSGLYRANVDGSNITQLLGGNQFSIAPLSNLIVSPDGTKLAFISRDIDGRGARRIWTLNSNGENLTQLDLNGFAPEARSLVHDFEMEFLTNESIVYVSELSNTERVVRVVLAGSVPVEVIAEESTPRSYADINIVNSMLVIETDQDVSTFQNGSVSRSHNSGYELIIKQSLTQLTIQPSLSNTEPFSIDNVDAYAFNDSGNLIAIGDSVSKELTLYDGVSGEIEQSLSFGADQQAQFTQGEQIQLSNFLRSALASSLFGSGFTAQANNLPNSLFDNLIGRISNIVWNPDGSEFVFLFEDYFASMVNTDGCETAIGDGDFFTDCPVNTPGHIRDLMDRYQTLDGIYVANLRDSSIKLIAKTNTVNASFSPVGFGRLTTVLNNLSPRERFSQNALNTRLNDFGFPITPDGFPYVGFVGASWIYGSDRFSLRSMYWLNGARELLITNGDESQLYNLRAPSNDRFGSDVEELNPQDLPANNTVLLNLDNPEEQTREVFSDTDLITHRQPLGEREITPSNTGNLLLFNSEDEFDSCANGETIGFRQFQSLLNMTADLRVRRAPARGGFILEGSAVDKHLESYQLSYADVNQPDVWISIAPPQSNEVIDSEFTTWVPPFIGDFLVRLTVNDKAGNSREQITRLNNREFSPISGLFVSESFFSPNGDGIKDTTALNFRVADNVNLDFQIFDESDRLVFSQQASFDVIGSQQNFVWDGRNNNGQIVADGVYRIAVFDFEFFVTLDTTSPVLQDLSPHFFEPRNEFGQRAPCDFTNTSNESERESPGNCLVNANTAINGTVEELYLENIVLQSRPINSGEWQDIPNALDAIVVNQQLQTTQLRNNDAVLNLGVLDWQTTEFRLSARDLAGNEAFLAVGQLKGNRAHIISVSGEGSDPTKNAFGYGSRPGFGLIPNYVNSFFGLLDGASGTFQHTATAPVQSVELMYRDATQPDSAYFSLPAKISVDESSDAGVGRFSYTLDELNEVSSNQVEAFIRLRLVNAVVIDSDKIRLVHNLSFGIYPRGTDLAAEGASSSFPRVALRTTYPIDAVRGLEVDLISRGGRFTDLRYAQPVRIFDSTSFVSELTSADTPTISDCGFGYEIEARLTLNDGSVVIDTFSQVEACVQIEARPRPILATQCDASSTNEVTIELRAITTDPIRPYDPNESDSTTPLLLEVGLPSADESDQSSLSERLYVNNFPELVEQSSPRLNDVGTFDFVLDTTPFPEGDLTLRAIMVFIDGSRFATDFQVPVVHSQPIIDITFPRDGDKLCGINYFTDDVNSSAGNESGEVLGIEIQGDVSTTGPDMLLEIQSLPLSNFSLLGSRVSRDDELSLVADLDDQGVSGRRRVSDNVFVSAAPFRASPITNRLTTSGVLAITALEGGRHTLRIEATNWGSARQCQTLTIDVDAGVDDLEITPEQAATVLHPPYDQLRALAISPNDDEAFDAVSFSYSVGEVTTVDIDVFSTEFETVDDTESIITDLELVAQPYQSRVVNAGADLFEWNGQDDVGEVLPDGVYRVNIRSQDGCGHVTDNSFFVVIDTAPPSLAINQPSDGDNIAIQPRVFGNINDIHPNSYQLLVSENGVDFAPVHQGQFSNIESDPTNPLGIELGQLNLLGQSGARTLRLLAQDQLGNEAIVEHVFTIPQRQNLITSLDTTEFFVSPNADQRLDNLIIRVGFDLDVIASVTILDSNQNVVRTLSSDVAYPAGLSTLVWDGADNLGEVPQDAVYSVQVVAGAAGNLQTEATAFEVDTTPPTAEFFNVVDGYVQLQGRATVFGSTADKNFESHRLQLVPQAAGESGLIDPVLLAESNFAANGTLATIPPDLSELEEAFALSLIVADRAGNQFNVERNVVLDQTPPRVAIINPVDGAVVGNESVVLQGSVEDAFLRNYTASIAPAGQPQEQTQLAVGDSNIDGDIRIFDLQSFDDGPHVITLSATDLSGLSSSTSVEIILDATPPTVGIIDPQFGAIISAVQAIQGSANDEHFSQYQLLVANGHVGEEGTYELLTTSNRQVVGSALFNWSELPEDGPYTLQLTASDTVGNQSTVFQQFVIDTAPPLTPVLTSVDFSQVNIVDIDVVWQANTETDLAGYYVYRNGSRINAELILETALLDPDVIEGEQNYQVSAVDQSGLESELSNSLSIIVDRTPPEVNISLPSDQNRVNLLVDIIGTAFSESDFASYRLFIGQSGSDLSLVHESPLATQNDLLFQWDTTVLPNNTDYTIRLEAQDTNGNEASDQITVTVDGEAPIAPDNLAASIVGTNDGQITWEYPGDISELQGFLLFRNGEIANSSGPVIGALDQFAIAELSYADNDLSDGQYEYQVFAIDLAGNLSDGSNIDSFTLDLGPPSAEYINIENGQAFDQSLFLIADTPDTDIAEIVMQYRSIDTDDWQTITTVRNRPYEHTWQTESLPDGSYQIRAVATDTSGNTDNRPDIFRVEKRDILAPGQVVDLSVSVNHNIATLSWIANTEADLANYYIYQHECRECPGRMIDDVEVGTEIYEDFESDDFEFYYSVSAVDEVGNEGQASDLQSAIFTLAQLRLLSVEDPQNPNSLGATTSPLIFPATERVLEVSVPFIRDADNRSFRQLTASETVVNIINPIDEVSEVNANHDPEVSESDHLLTFSVPGVHEVSAAVTSTQNNFTTIGDQSLTLLYQGQPSIPTDLIAQADDVSGETRLSWSANPSEDQVVAYRVIKNGNSINTSQLIEDASAFSESGGPIENILPSSDFADSWASRSTGRAFGQRWAQPRLVNQVSLFSTSFFDSPASFDVYALVNDELLTVDSRPGGFAGNYTLNLPNPIVTTEIRIVVNRWRRSSGGRINRMIVSGEDLHRIPDFYSESFDGVNSDFALQAINTFGGVSVPTAPVELQIGDGTPPLPVELAVTAIESQANLSWTESAGANRYRVFQDGEFILETTELSTTVFDLANGVYQYYVIAVDPSGTESEISNIAEAIINIALPASPIQLLAAANNELFAIDLEWRSFDPASSTGGNVTPLYNVYRSESSGVDFIQIGQTNTAEFTDLTVDDNVRYFYQVTELDNLGNESTPSNEASATLDASGGFGRVSLSVPTDQAQAFLTDDPFENVGGLAPAGSNVFLLHDDEFLPEPVRASADIDVIDLVESLRSIPGNENGGLSRFLSSDRGDHVAIFRNFPVSIAYRYVNEQWQVIQNEGQGFNQLARPDDDTLFLITTQGRSSSITIVDLASNDSSRIAISLPSEFRFSSSILGYSPEHEYVIVQGSHRDFDANLFRLSLDTLEVLPLPESLEFSVSPSARYYAYQDPNAVEPTIRVFDVLTSQASSTVLAQANLAGSVLSNANPWSPDESRLILSSSHQNVVTGDTLDSLIVFDHLDQESFVISNPSFTISSAAWSSENTVLSAAQNQQTFAILRTNITNARTQLLHSVPPSYTGPRILERVINPATVVFTNDGFNREYIEYSIPGSFVFADVPLRIGSNLFSAVAVDSEGNVFDPSAQIEIIRQAQALPDYSIDVELNPELPVLGSNAAFNITVNNDSDFTAEQTNLVIQVSSVDNGNVLLVEQQVGPLQAGASANVSVPWQPEFAGAYSVIVEVDQQEIIAESNESNNTIIKGLTVFADRVVDIQNQLDLSQNGDFIFDITEPISGNVVLRNPGSSVNGTIIVDVVDLQDNVVAVIESYNVSGLANGDEFVQSYTWLPTGTALGDYSVRAQFSNTLNDTVSADQDALTLVEDLQIVLGVNTNQFSYASNEEVVVTATTLNRSAVATLTSGVVRLSINANNGDLLFSDELPIAEVLAGDRSALVFNWNTGLTQPGRLNVTAELIQQSNELARATTALEVRPSILALQGSLFIEDDELGLNQPLVFNSAVTNRGNVALGAFNIRYILRDASGQVRSLNQSVASLASDAQLTTPQALETNGLDAGSYRLLMQAEFTGLDGQLTTQILDDNGFSITQSTAPVVIIQQPIAASVFNSEGRQALIFALDDSLVTRVDARFGDDEWNAITSSTFEPSRYTLPLENLSEGPQVLAVRAVDDQENESSITRRRFVIDNTPPLISIENIIEGQTLSESIVPSIAIADANPGTQSIELNGAVLASGAEINVSGSYILRVTATDLAGNTSSTVTRFVLDIEQPERPLNAVDDTLPVSRGVFATIDLLANDSFNNLDDLQVSIVSNPRRGRLVRASKGVYNYSPQLLALGLDSFEYQLTDTRTGETSQATVSVDISPVASCSFVPDHSTRSPEGVVLINWARNSNDLDQEPRFRINIVGTSDDSAFVAGQEPAISFPNCSLSYTARANVRSTVTVRYTVTDVATGGQSYTSPVREFTLDINTRSFSETVIMPILQLLLFEDEREQQ